MPKSDPIDLQPATAPATPPAATPPADDAAAYARHLPAAKALHADAVSQWNVDPALMHANVVRGVTAVLAERPYLAKPLPQTDWAKIERAPDLASAAWHAHTLADVAVTTPDRPFAEHRRAVSEHREQLLAVATRLVGRGHASAEAVAKIREGRGALDLAADVLALCELVGAAGKGADGLVTAAELAEAKEDATGFRDRVRPEARLGDHAKQGAAAAAADVRDRLFTVLADAHSEVRRVALWRWIEDADAHAPRLGRRRV
jgi:hypothetical protein